MKNNQFKKKILKCCDSNGVNRVFKATLRKICDEDGLELVQYDKIYFEGSAFIRRKDGCLFYISLQDVRFFPSFAESILYRTVKNTEDYRGGPNHYSDIESLGCSLNEER